MRHCGPNVVAGAALCDRARDHAASLHDTYLVCSGLQVLGVAFQAVGSIAVLAKSDFSDHFVTFAALASATISAVGAPQTVRNKALESFCRMCAAVGRGMASANALSVLDGLVGLLVRDASVKCSTGATAPMFGNILQHEGVSNRDNAFEYVCRSIVHLARMLGPDFGPYLERTLPPLAYIAAVYSGVTVYDRATIDDAQLEGSSWKEHEGRVYVMLHGVLEQKVLLRVG